MRVDLADRLIAGFGDLLGLLLERRFASKDYRLLHEVVYTGYELSMASTLSRWLKFERALSDSHKSRGMKVIELSA